MAKIIKYEFVAYEVTRGPESASHTEPVIRKKLFECNTQEQFDASYAIAEAEALPGTLTVSGEFNPAPDPGTEPAAIWDELDAAYQRGVDSV